MTLTRSELKYALADEMAKRLRLEEDWISTARWLLDRALDSGFDLSGLREDSPEVWSNDLMDSLGFHVDFEEYWPDGPEEEGTGDDAETLFWCLLPYPIGLRRPAYLVRSSELIGKKFPLTPDGRKKITGATSGPFSGRCFAVDAHRDGTGTIRLDWYETSDGLDYGTSDFFMRTELEAAREIVRILNEHLPGRVHARTEYPPDDEEPTEEPSAKIPRETQVDGQSEPAKAADEGGLGAQRQAEAGERPSGAGPTAPAGLQSDDDLDKLIDSVIEEVFEDSKKPSDPIPEISPEADKAMRELTRLFGGLADGKRAKKPQNEQPK